MGEGLARKQPEPIGRRVTGQWHRQSIPKCQHIKFRCQGITQKKAYNRTIFLLWYITWSNLDVWIDWNIFATLSWVWLKILWLVNVNSQSTNHCVMEIWCVLMIEVLSCTNHALKIYMEIKLCEGSSDFP
jgi:hypothetical protein